MDELVKTTPPHLLEQVRNGVARVLTSIMLIRMAKILSRPSLGENLTVEEERIARIVAKLLRASRAPTDREYVAVLFLDKFPQIVTSDGAVLGPFEAGDIAKLPTVDARELELSGNVVRIKIRLVGGEPRIQETGETGQSAGTSKERGKV